MAKNTYKQDEVLEEPFDIRHLLRASSYIKKYAGRMVVAILLSGIGGAFGYVAPMIIQRALDLAIPDKNEKLLFSLVGMLVGIYVVSVIFTTIRSRIMVHRHFHVPGRCADGARRSLRRAGAVRVHGLDQE